MSQETRQSDSNASPQLARREALKRIAKTTLGVATILKLSEANAYSSGYMSSSYSSYSSYSYSSYSYSSYSYSSYCPHGHTCGAP